MALKPAQTSLALLTAGLLLAVPTAHALEVHDARTPEPPPAAPVLAGYMHLENDRDEDVEITGASSPAFAYVEIHATESADGTASMSELASLTVPAGGSVRFEPRGKHLMLYTPEAEFTPGDEFPVTLETSVGAIEATFSVVERDTIEDDHDH